MSPGYDYVEGEVAVPASKCTRCGGPLQPSENGTGTYTGWFRPSRLGKAIWIFKGTDEPKEGERSALSCPKCQRLFNLLATA